MSTGLHGENVLDSETSVHLYQMYVVPVLFYGLEVVLVGKFNKKYLKCLLSFPVTVADTAVYILSGTVPMQGVIEQ